MVFFVGDIMMRHHTCSAAELKMYGMSEEDFKSFQTVRKALTKADVPPYKRKVVHGSVSLPYKSFDPLIMNGIQALNREWRSHNFVLCVTWMDVDDDKQPNCSPLWVVYGCRVTPTKDKN